MLRWRQEVNVDGIFEKGPRSKVYRTQRYGQDKRGRPVMCVFGWFELEAYMLMEITAIGRQEISTGPVYLSMRKLSAGASE